MNKALVFAEQGGGDDRAAVVSRFANLETTSKIQDDTETCRILLYTIKAVAFPLNDEASCEFIKNAVEKAYGDREKELLRKGYQDSVYPAQKRDATTRALDVFEPSSLTLGHRPFVTHPPRTVNIRIWDTDIEEPIWLSPMLLLFAVIGAFVMGSWESSQRQQHLTAAGFMPSIPDADWAFLYATPATLIIAIATITLSLTWYHYLQGFSKSQNPFVIGSAAVVVVCGALTGYTGTETLLQLVPLSIIAGFLLAKVASAGVFGTRDRATLVGMVVPPENQRVQGPRYSPLFSVLMISCPVGVSSSGA
ncbi:hypothetical protein B0T22DRAFT_476189 [Podospora appendiculata]|uniref:Uncharacterized protein n=1 Tax=Podospora appendiculata TaxID=314037 RepID=A0AAE1CG51_9PEZI|nr:hypothetical protein B0T22DRAFT_476189 [Podospora appendiculata]